MGNPQKRKGDKAELEAVEVLRALTPHLVVAKPGRMLGAGRLEDVGDLHVYPDVAIQVRNLKAANIGLAIRSSALDAVQQAANGDVLHALGLVPIPRASKAGVRWLACVAPGHWPTPVEPVADFQLVSRAITWLRDDEGPYGYTAWPREQRVARISHGNAAPVLVAPIEAWVAAYRATRAQHDTHSGDSTAAVTSIESAKMLHTHDAPAAQSA